MKLRAAWGQAGRAPGAFDAVRTWDPVGWGGSVAFEPENVGNPNGAYDAWETTNWKGEPYSFSEIDLSFPISESEMDTNPNVSQARPF